MKVLVVCSGNSKQGINPIIKNQIDSLSVLNEFSFEYYRIKGKGICGYLNNIKPLRQFIAKGDYSVIHAHYSSSAFVASLAGSRKLVVSLMGSDVKSGRFNVLIIRLFNKLYSWERIIVKSNDMKNSLGLQEAVVIPNGVDLNKFFPIDKNESRNMLGWDPKKIHLLFASDPERYEKNFNLLSKTLELLNDTNIELHFLKNIPYSDIPYWYNASDVVVLTSFWEGSPNAIKEAMACNCPILATKVGDIEWLFGDMPGYFLTENSETECRVQIENAIVFSQTSGKTNGRERILNLGLDSQKVAEQISAVYKTLNSF